MRTAIAAGTAALIAFPDIARVLSIENLPGVALIMGISLALTRVFALPSVDSWIDQYAPWIATEPPADTHDER